MLRGNNKEKGFTLIELILVIVILGILTAVALPRFIDLDADARRARNQGALAAFRGAITMLHGKFLINGTTYSTVNLIADTDVQGGVVTDPSGVGTGLLLTWDDATVHTFTYTPLAAPVPASVVCSTADCS